MTKPVAQSNKCLLVQPMFSRSNILNFKDAAKLVGAKYTSPPLGLLTVAALLPQHWEFRLVDENIRSLTEEDFEWADIVFTGGMLPQQPEVLRIIDHAHMRGKPVVVGGVDPTTQTSIYGRADYLVLGEGEVTIPLFLNDLFRGATSGLYRSETFADMNETVVPRFDLVQFSDYVRVDVQFSRGCPYHCEFCAVVELFGRRPRSKTVGQIFAELQSLYDLGYRGHINLLDDNFLGSKARGLMVLRALKGWSEEHDNPFFFSTDASINLAKEEELLQLMHQNDFRYLFVGIESPDEDVLHQTQKKHNTGLSMVDAVRTFNEHGMSVIGGFILGFDNETEETAQQMVDLIQETGIVMAYTGMLVALPNTQLWSRLQQEGRLFHGDLMLWESLTGDYTVNGLNFATIRPRTHIMRSYVGVLRQIYGPENYYRRVLTTANRLVPNYKYRPSLATLVRQIQAFVKVSIKAGLNRQTGVTYWRTLMIVLIRRPSVLQFFVTMAALYTHFSKLVDSIIRTLEEKVRDIEHTGEAQYDALMISKSRLAEVVEPVGHIER